MPFNDNPLRHIADGTGLRCERCGAEFPEIAMTAPGKIRCSKTGGWFLGDLPWAKDCVPTETT